MSDPQTVRNAATDPLEGDTFWHDGQVVYVDHVTDEQVYWRVFKSGEFWTALRTNRVNWRVMVESRP